MRMQAVAQTIPMMKRKAPRIQRRVALKNQVRAVAALKLRLVAAITTPNMTLPAKRRMPQFMRPVVPVNQVASLLRPRFLRMRKLLRKIGGKMKQSMKMILKASKKKTRQRRSLKTSKPKRLKTPVMKKRTTKSRPATPMKSKKALRMQTLTILVVKRKMMREKMMRMER